MVANEVFIDSATLRENVVSLARNIGYLPRSRKVSKSNCYVFSSIVVILPLHQQHITLKKGPVASTSGTFGNQSFVFSIVS